MKENPIILVVDDQPQNIELLEAHLMPQGYEIIRADSGKDAINIISDKQVDLILLDVMMPGMDGYEVCRILKQEADYIPVIMITALGDRDSRIRGIESGADDFLSKPFDSTELKLKIKNFLKIKFLYNKVEKNYHEIKILSKLKDDLTTFIVHDLRSPLTGILGYLDLLSMSKHLTIQDLADVENAKQSARMMKNMISNLLDVAKMENNELKINAEDCELEMIVSSAVKVITPLLNEKNIHLLDKTKENGAIVKAQSDLIERVVQNLLSNAVHYTPERGNIIIECKTDSKSKLATVSVSDDGHGIPKEHKLNIFEKFATVEAKEKRIRSSTGLGLAFCKLALELHGGKIWVEDRNGGGSIFSFTLPLSE